jgi:protein subunit release factor B
MKFPVSETKENDLHERMRKCGIFENDLIEDFVKGSGKGGQKINKTSMAVYLKHLPTGVEVRCQESRSQAMNRFLARRLLVEKLEERIFQKQSAKQQEHERIRRQKRKRTKKAKEKILSAKHHKSEKKSFRKRPTSGDY